MPAVPAVDPSDLPELKVNENEYQFEIIGSSFKVVFDRKRGQISSFAYNEHELLTAGPHVNIWRAPTDNDAPVLGRQWYEVGYDRLKITNVAAELTVVQPDCSDRSYCPC